MEKKVIWTNESLECLKILFKSYLLEWKINDAKGWILDIILLTDQMDKIFGKENLKLTQRKGKLDYEILRLERHSVIFLETNENIIVLSVQ